MKVKRVLKMQNHNRVKTLSKKIVKNSGVWVSNDHAMSCSNCDATCKKKEMMKAKKE